MKTRITGLILLIALLLSACSPMTTLNVAAASLSPDELNLSRGETRIFRFAIWAPRPTGVQSLTLNIQRFGSVTVDDFRIWYGNLESGSAIGEVSPNGKVTFHFKEPYLSTYSGKDKALYTVVAKVTGEGVLAIQIIEMESEFGKIKGLPTAHTIITVE